MTSLNGLYASSTAKPRLGFYQVSIHFSPLLRSISAGSLVILDPCMTLGLIIRSSESFTIMESSPSGRYEENIFIGP